jgi:hypothetical protein
MQLFPVGIAHKFDSPQFARRADWKQRCPMRHNDFVTSMVISLGSVLAATALRPLRPFSCAARIDMHSRLSARWWRNPSHAEAGVHGLSISSHSKMLGSILPMASSESAVLPENRIDEQECGKGNAQMQRPATHCAGEKKPAMEAGL